ncbi:MAG: DUF2331 family protein, partial [Betaproteobacteria bacterium]|nr:DUF2331 family protein [Betaproteobacteria bacterium]
MHTAEPGSAQGLTSAQDGRSRLALRVALFCQVIDHFGDIGVSLRLARSLITKQCQLPIGHRPQRPRESKTHSDITKMI